MIDDVREAIGVERAAPALFSLPADRASPRRRRRRRLDRARRTGRSRRLGGYRDAAWSPFGRFVAAAGENELVALEPDGDVRWSLARPGRPAPGLGRDRDRHEDRVPQPRRAPRRRRRRHRGPRGVRGRRRRRRARVAARRVSTCSPSPAPTAASTPTTSTAADSSSARPVAGVCGSLEWSTRRATAARRPRRAGSTSSRRERVAPWTGIRPAGRTGRGRGVPAGQPRDRVRRRAHGVRPRSRWSPRAAACSSRARAGSTGSSGRRTAAGCCSPGATPTSGSSSARAAGGASRPSRRSRGSSARRTFPTVAGWCCASSQ